MKTNHFKITILALAGALAFTNCDRNEPTPNTAANGEGKFIIMTDTPESDRENTHFTSTLEKGVLNPSGAVENSVADLAEIVINGKTYAKEQNAFTEFGLNASNQMNEIRRIPAANWRGVTVSLGDNKALAYRADYLTDGIVPFEVYDVAAMTVIKSGTFNLPVITGHSIWPNNIIKRGNQILLPYMMTNDETYSSVDTGYVAIYNAADYSLIKILKDTRINSLGYNFFDDHFFDTNGDLYLSNVTSYYWGLSETQPSAVIRIKAGEDVIDNSYLFNITEKVGNEYSNGLFYIGNKKALTRVFKKSITANDYSKYANGYSMETWLLDLNANNAVKLDIPLSKNPYVNFVRLNNGKVAIPSNTADGNYIYIFDPNSNTISKGLEYQGADIREVFSF